MQTKVNLSVRRGFPTAIRHDPPRYAMCSRLDFSRVRWNARRDRFLHVASDRSSIHDPRRCAAERLHPGRDSGHASLSSPTSLIMAVYGLRARDFSLCVTCFLTPSARRDAGMYPMMTSTNDCIFALESYCSIRSISRDRHSTFGVSRFPVVVRSRETYVDAALLRDFAMCV